MSVIKRRQELIFLANLERYLSPTPGAIGKDYMGNNVYPEQRDLHKRCSRCNNFVWHKHIVYMFCPICAMALSSVVIVISLSKSKSRSYETALKRIRAFPSYVQESDRHVVRFNSLGEFCEHREMARALSGLVARWKSAAFTFNGHLVTADSIDSLCLEINRMRDLAGAKSIAFDSEGQVIYTLKSRHPNNIIQLKKRE
jgi:hypothetical protein